MNMILRLFVRGLVAKEIAKALNVTKWTVGKYLRDPRFRDLVKAYNDEVLFKRLDEEIAEKTYDHIERMSQLTESALDTMEELLGTENEAIRFKAAQDLLDRNPETSRMKKVEVNDKDNNPLSPEMLMAMAATIQEEENYTTIQGELPSGAAAGGANAG